MREIKQLLVDVCNNNCAEIYDCKYGKIERIYKNGEMAEIEWFKQIREDGSEEEINGKYVISVICK